MKMSLDLIRLDACPLCGNEDGLERLVVTRDFETDAGEFPIDVCPACGLAFTNPRPTEQSIPLLYSQRSTPDFATGSSGLVRKLRHVVMRRYLNARLPADTDELDMLDFGCGDGSLSICAAQIGSERNQSIRVTSVDFHDEAPTDLANTKLAVTYRNYPSWRSTPELRHDVIFLRHVLEHHPDPTRLLGELCQTLKPGGTIHVEVPNRRTVWAKLFGMYYFAYYTPRHLVHFDMPSLERVTTQSGLRVASLGKGHTPVIGRSVGQALGRDIDNLGLFGLCTYPFQVVVDLISGGSTTLRLTARK